jgi:hypothetical protein
MYGIVEEGFEFDDAESFLHDVQGTFLKLELPGYDWWLGSN